MRLRPVPRIEHIFSSGSFGHSRTHIALSDPSYKVLFFNDVCILTELTDHVGECSRHLNLRYEGTHDQDKGARKVNHALHEYLSCHPGTIFLLLVSNTCLEPSVNELDRPRFVPDVQGPAKNKISPVLHNVHHDEARAIAS